MRFLADENMHKGVVMRLRAAGLDVEWISHSTPGVSDRHILLRPDIGQHVLITGDSDFGDLIFNGGMPSPNAILYVRLAHLLVELTADRLLALVERGGFEGHIITITKDGERRKPFPAGA